MLRGNSEDSEAFSVSCRDFAVRLAQGRYRLRNSAMYEGGRGDRKPRIDDCLEQTISECEGLLRTGSREKDDLTSAQLVETFVDLAFVSGSGEEALRELSADRRGVGKK